MYMYALSSFHALQLVSIASYIIYIVIRLNPISFTLFKMDLAFSTSAKGFFPQFSHPIISRSTPVSPLNLVHNDRRQRLQIAYASFDSPSHLLNLSLTQGGLSTSRHRSFSLLPHSTRGSGGVGDEDHKALDVVLRLYSAMKSRKPQELSDIIADECRCICHFFSTFHPFEGKKQVLEFFTALMRQMGNSIDFVIQPTLNHGLMVGVNWSLVWERDNIRLPFGRGTTFYTCHKYQGRLCISHVDMYMEPLLNLVPLRLKVMEYMMPILDKIPSREIKLTGAGPLMYGLLTLLVIPIILKRTFF